MAQTGVVALDLGQRLPCLLHDHVRVVPFDDDLHVGSLVPWNHDEAGHISCDPIVFSRRELDLFNAGFNAALTVEGKSLLDTMFLGTLLDPVVDRPKNLFVVCGSIREVHRSIFPRGPAACGPSA